MSAAKKPPTETKSNIGKIKSKVKGVKFLIIKSNKLGIKCWMPIRFNNQCYLCERYHRCHYPEKARNLVYESLYRQIRIKIKELNQAKEALRVWLRDVE